MIWRHISYATGTMIDYLEDYGNDRRAHLWAVFCRVEIETGYYEYKAGRIDQDQGPGWTTLYWTNETRDEAETFAREANIR